MRATDPAIRKSAVLKLGNSRNAFAMNALVAALADDDNTVQVEAAEALGRALAFASALGDRAVLLAAEKALRRRLKSTGGDVLTSGILDHVTDALKGN
jgi:HEAT repeat protein